MEQEKEKQAYLDQLVAELLADPAWDLPKEERKVLLGDLAFRLLTL